MQSCYGKRSLDRGARIAITKLDKSDQLILDDLTCAAKDPAEPGVLFELISARYERRTVRITANQPWGERPGGPSEPGLLFPGTRVQNVVTQPAPSPQGQPNKQLRNARLRR